MKNPPTYEKWGEILKFLEDSRRCARHFLASSSQPILLIWPGAKNSDVFPGSDGCHGLPKQDQLQMGWWRWCRRHWQPVRTYPRIRGKGTGCSCAPAIATSARHEDQQVISGRLPVARCVQDAPLTAPGDRQTQVLQPQVLKLKEENLRLGGAWRWLQQHRQDHQHIQPQHQHDPRLLQALQDFQAAIQRLKHLLLLPDFPVRVHPDSEDQPPQIPQQAPLQQPAPTPQPSPQTPTRSHSDAGQEGRAWWSSLLGPAPGQEQASESVPQLQEVQAVLLQATRHVLGRMLLLPPGLTLR